MYVAENCECKLVTGAQTMAFRTSAPQYVGTVQEAKEAVENLVVDLEVSCEACSSYILQYLNYSQTIAVAIATTAALHWSSCCNLHGAYMHADSAKCMGA